ncbi:MAG: YbaK/EbsC family protein [Caldilineaceae bacterium]
MIQRPPISTILTNQSIPHSVFRHLASVNSLEQAAAERGQTPDQIVRSILFRLEQTQFVMVLVAGPGQISWRTLRQQLGQSRITTATPEEVLAVTGYPIGAVAPFGLCQPLPILVDESVTKQEELSIGSGVRGTAIILRTADLLRALGDVTIGNFKAA